MACAFSRGETRLFINKNYSVFAKSTNGETIGLDGQLNGLCLRTINNTKINIYPNPVDYKLYVSSTENIKELKIYSVNGSLVFASEPNDSKFMITTEDLQKGLYVIRLTSESGIEYFKKLVK